MIINFVDFIIIEDGFYELRIENSILNSLDGLRIFASVSTCVLGFAYYMDATK